MPRKNSALKAWNLIMEDPHPLLHLVFNTNGIKYAMGSRNALASNPLGAFLAERATMCRFGDYLDFFLVEYSDETTLILTERKLNLILYKTKARQISLPGFCFSFCLKAYTNGMKD